MSDIEDLSDNIELVGLQQNLVVAPSIDGKYPLLAGHRRLAALKLLVEEKGRAEFQKVPAIINDPQAFEYQLSDENKEALLWVSSNIMARKPTPQDLLTFSKTLSEIYKELREKNPGLVIGTRKEYIAKELNISESQVQILNSINSHLVDRALKAFLENRLSLVVARDLSKMSEADQNEFLDTHEDLDDISSGDILLFKKKLKERIKSIEYLEEFSSESFSKVASLYERVAGLADIANLSGVKAAKAQKLANSIESDLEKLRKLLVK